MLSWAYTPPLGAAAVVALVLGIRPRRLGQSGHQDLIVLNAFARPLSVQAGGITTTVPAKGRANHQPARGRGDV
jgi:hypothetical protein